MQVMNIERFATHDGPGIRTCVFLKGCPLHCPWCANPETQDPTRPVLFHDACRCAGCRACEKVCAEATCGAISFDGDEFRFDPARCTACGACERACLHEALELQGRERTVDEILDLVMRDRDYYEASGGGLTISGGEPLMFADQAVALLAGARERGLDTAVETTGNVPRATIERVEPLVDHFLFDVKHLDPDVLHDVTGASAPLVCDNLTYLAERCPGKVRARVPVIPGFNCEDATVRAIVDLVRNLDLTAIDLLPYHTLGREKYRKMGRAYGCPDHMLHDSDLAAWRDYAQSLGMDARIGG